MAKRFNKRGKGGGNRPHMSIAFSYKKGDEYVKGPSFGLWRNEDGDVPAARGSVKEEYLAELAEFLSKADKRGRTVSAALFENSGKAKKSRDEDDDDDEDTDDEEDEPRKKGKRDEDDEDDD